jgi:ABC-type multidrug transport system permease subunit
MSKISNHQLYRLIRSHFLEIVREPAVLFWGVVFPILMAWGLGIAFTKKGDLTGKVAIVKYVGTEHKAGESKLFDFLQKNTVKSKNKYSIELRNEKLGNLSLTFIETSWPEAYKMLKKGNISLIIEDHADDIKYHFDPASSEALNLYQQVTNVLAHGKQAYTASQQEIEPLTISGTRYIDFLIPGLLAMGIMMSCTWGISYTLIDRRSKKLLRRMVATPMKKSNFLLALITARFSMNIVEASILFLFAWLYFGIHIQGSIVALIAIFLAGNIAFSGISILVSSHTANPEVGNGIINAIVTPMMVISGVFFSYHNFPEWSIPVIRNFPLTILADSMRSVFNESTNLVNIYKEIIILSATGIICFIIGLKIFKWY